MSLEPVLIHSITPEQIQQIVHQSLLEKRMQSSKVFALDISYLYSFDLPDIPFIRKYSELIKQEYKVSDKRKYIRHWHRSLEQWLLGEYSLIFDKKIKPLQITSDIHRVTNEMLGLIARSFTGQDFSTMAHCAVGDGAEAGSNPSPNDTDLQHEVDRINVIFETGGGALSIDGFTFYSVANFSKNMPPCTATESGLFDREKPGTGGVGVNTIDDRMGEHSIFENEVEHEQGANAIGVTTTIFFCAS